MVEEIRDASSWYRARCEVCGKEEFGYQSVHFIVYKFVKEHEDTCRIKHDCMR